LPRSSDPPPGKAAATRAAEAALHRYGSASMMDVDEDKVLAERLLADELPVDGVTVLGLQLEPRTSPECRQRSVIC
jgi:hypothetical protein